MEVYVVTADTGGEVAAFVFEDRGDAEAFADARRWVGLDAGDAEGQTVIDSALAASMTRYVAESERQ